MAGRVGVIGAGSSGVTAVKNLVDAGFTDIVCFERRDVIGGLWHYKEDTATWVDEACVNRSTVINTSKEFMSYSDYPMPDDFPNFCHNEEVQHYFKDYCKHFGAEKYIQYNKEVLLVTKHSSYNSTGRWQVRVKDHKTGQESSEVFDFLIVANGHHGEPYLPKFPGLEKFKGVTMHSKEFKDMNQITGSRAIVVGIGNSGGDCAVEISKYMKVFLATRRGAWIQNRLVQNGMPWDVDFHVRFRIWLLGWIPRSWRNRKLKEILNLRFNHDLYHLTPIHEPDATHPTVNDELPNRIAAGMVVVKPNIKNFTEKGVTFEDGTFEDNIDVVIFATGYNVDYPFIDKGILQVKDNKVSMFRHMFLPNLPKQTLAFLGVCQPLGAMFPIAEMQTRLAARVFKGEVQLPSSEAMKRDIREHQEKMRRQYIDTQRHTIQVDWLPYMDELAVMVGCKPNLLKLLVTDPVLFHRVAFGPGVPYQFRLHGPNPWPGARQAIMTVMDRVNKPFETRQIPRPQNQGTPWLKYLIVTSLAAGLITYGASYANQNNIDLMEYVPKALQFN